MRRNTHDWIARIFSVVTAGSVPAIAGCNESMLPRVADMKPAVDLARSTDLAPAIDMGPATEDMTPATDDLGPEGDMSLQTIRRPFLVGGSLRAAPAVHSEDWLKEFPPAEGLDVATRRALAASWLKDALEEHASVAAFARFSMMGLAVGAPPEIIAASQRASLDEIRHARVCFGLARRYGASEAGPGGLALDGAFTATTLSELAALTAQEGCVGETLGALLAEEQARVATDPWVKEALAGIAADERRHSELAWRFTAWACTAGGAPVVKRVGQAIAAAVAHTRAGVVRPLAVDAALWHAHGRLSCAESKAIGERGLVEIVLPALARLSASRLAS